LGFEPDITHNNHRLYLLCQGAQRLNLLGGNQNDQVNVKAYPASKLLGVRRAIAPRSNPSECTTL
jgi:hypothetical protein